MTLAGLLVDRTALERRLVSGAAAAAEGAVRGGADKAAGIGAAGA